ncbi:MAG: glycosyltransferase family 2 protein [Candidatus Woesebacteria bacterium]|nr:glycosyltransferase family 2 protein [Candidatus Woesebacteria bacterium]
MVKVSLIILSWNAGKMTQEELQNVALLDTNGLDAECVVVDNGSTDDTQDMLSNYKLPNMGYKFIETNLNLGYAGGNNVGLKYAFNGGSDYAILLNNDVILPKDILTKLVGIAEKDQRIGLLAPKMYFAEGYEFHKDRYKKEDLGKVIWYAGGFIDWDNVYLNHRGVDEVDRGQYDKKEVVDAANGACLLIKNKVIRNIGFLRDKYFMYWEDADYSLRAKIAGWKVVYTPKTCLWHKVSASSGIGSNLNDYFLTRNRLDFGLKYASLKIKMFLIKESLRFLIAGRTWQKIGVRDYYLGRWGKGSWGKK